MSNVFHIENIGLKRDIKRIKALNPDSQLFKFSELMYKKRERMLGEASTTDLDYLLDSVDVNIDSITHRGEKLLFLAIDFTSPLLLDYLVNKGADTSVKSSKGLTLLEHIELTTEGFISSGYKTTSHTLTCLNNCKELLLRRGNNE